MTRTSKAFIVLTVGLIGAATTTAFADSPWERNHPRRDQVNDRLAFQNWRINKEVREGEIGRWQAFRLHNQDRMIRAEERAMAGFNHGHITGAEQRALNQQENTVSRRIGH